jgi:hypothetical protein
MRLEVARCLFGYAMPLLARRFALAEGEAITVRFLFFPAALAALARQAQIVDVSAHWAAIRSGSGDSARSNVASIETSLR